MIAHVLVPQRQPGPVGFLCEHTPRGHINTSILPNLISGIYPLKNVKRRSLSKKPLVLHRVLHKDPVIRVSGILDQLSF